MAVASSGDGRDAVPLPGQPLRELGGDRLIGTAVRVDALEDDKAYRQLIAQQFSAVTPENEMKWGFLEPKRGKIDFGPADTLMRRAGEFGQQVRGHTLVWHFQMPSWAQKLRGDEFRAAVREHIAKVLKHYGDGVPMWDVVNEVVADNGKLRNSQYLRELGPGYIADAFRQARELVPKAKLWINEIGADGKSPKSDRLYKLVRDLRADGVPIDGVGFQSHFNTKNGVPAGYRENLERFAKLGVEIAITEADVGITMPADAQQLEQQARVYEEIARTCVAISACRGITLWGFTDSRSWIGETQPGQGAATLLDAKLRAKPAYAAFRAVLAGH